MRLTLIGLAGLLVGSGGGFAQEQPAAWSTFRGNAQRTGNTDGVAGPAEPKVLWAYKSKDHYVAAPVPAGDNVLFPGLGPFNRPSLAALPVTPKAVIDPTWTK